MKRKFNDLGLCVSHLHYMVDTSAKIDQIMTMVDAGEYFIINRPRQFGKTTTLSQLTNWINQQTDYLAMNISFELLDSTTYQQAETFIYEFLQVLLAGFEFLGLSEPVSFIQQHLSETKTIPALSRLITKLVRDKLSAKKLVLLIDEVDKSSNNQLFLHFLSMLRNKYLHRFTGYDHTFHSVILAGVHDIKTLKAKIRPDTEEKYNSPWNIAADFKVDLSFSPPEIETMLTDYSQEKGIELAKSAIAERLYYYTSGYPYLVSKLCKFIDEDIIPQRTDKSWSVADVNAAFKMIVDEAYTTILFDSLTKNLENNPDLYTLVQQIIINGKTLAFTITNPVINLGHMYGVLAPAKDGRCRIHNRIFEQRIYAHLMSALLQTTYAGVNRLGGPEFYTPEGLDMKLVLQCFQDFMREPDSSRDVAFLEREGRFIFLAYLRPIIDGRGFDFKEPNVSQERRMDIVITWQNKRYVLELKIWRGEQYHQQGLQQLSDYLDMYALKKGYLLIYNFNQNKTYKQEQITYKDKDIFAVWV